MKWPWEKKEGLKPVEIPKFEDRYGEDKPEIEDRMKLVRIRLRSIEREARGWKPAN